MAQDNLATQYDAEEICRNKARPDSFPLCEDQEARAVDAPGNGQSDKFVSVNRFFVGRIGIYPRTGTYASSGGTRYVVPGASERWPSHIKEDPG